MPKLPLEKKTLNLREGDWDVLTEAFKPRGLDTSVVVRRVVSRLVDKIKAAGDTVDPSEVDVDV